jgi:hypothetical protein
VKPLIFGTLLLAAACGSRPAVDDSRNLAAALEAKPNFFLRGSGLDQDPSAYLGRFVPDDAGPEAVDEAAAMRLACSEHFTVRKVKAGNVELDEYFTAGTSAAASLGLPAAGGSAAFEQGRVVRVRYRLTEKWIADLADPAGFEACCKRAGDQCTRRVVGEFLAGTGEILTTASQGLGADVAGTTGAAELKDGVAWSRKIRFDEPVFFAFRLTENRFTGPGTCAANWADEPPRSAQGRYFVGVSEWVESERLAREQAMFDARRQVVRYLGEHIRQGDARFGDEGFVQRSSAALAKFVKDECWKPEQYEGPEGWRYRARVLTFVPEAEVSGAAAALGGEE